MNNLNSLKPAWNRESTLLNFPSLVFLTALKPKFLWHLEFLEISIPRQVKNMTPIQTREYKLSKACKDLSPAFSKLKPLDFWFLKIVSIEPKR